MDGSSSGRRQGATTRKFRKAYRKEEFVGKTDGKQPNLEDPNSPSNSLATKPLEKSLKALQQAEHDQSVWFEVKLTSQDNPSTINLEATFNPNGITLHHH